MSARKRDIYIAIMVAAASGRGLHLTEAECIELTMDDAIATRASNALSEEEFSEFDWTGWPGAWPSIDPYADREPYNGAIREPTASAKQRSGE